MRKCEASEVESTAEVGTATFDQMMLSYENQLIRQALLTSQGCVSRAVQLLGTSHQRLISVIERRHKDLLSLRTPIKARKRNVKNE